MSDSERKETQSQLEQLFCRLTKKEREELLEAGEIIQQLKRDVENNEGKVI